MKIPEIADLFRRIKMVYPAFPVPDQRDALKASLDIWHEYLSDVSVDTARENLRRYVLDPENKYPPHPGALAKPLHTKTDADRFHEHMELSGIQTLEQIEHMRKTAVPPSPAQRQKVRDILARS